MCSTCVEWDGKTWHRYGNGHYETTVRLHREVWQAAHGPIPAGYHVHHINGDKGDNRLENLELLSHGEHSSRHAEEKFSPHRAKAMANSIAARQRNAGERLKRALECVICGAVYSSPSKHPTRFCSSACIERARSGAFAGESRACEYCGARYSAVRRTQRYCSKRCNCRAAEARSGQCAARNVACAHCGQSFRSSRTNARFCQRACALAFHADNRFRGKVGRAR